MKAGVTMRACYTVNNVLDHTVGFIIDKRFYNNYQVKKNIEFIDNLELLSNGSIITDSELPVKQYTEYMKELYLELFQDNQFQRDIQSTLLDWKTNRNNLILQLEGTRQVGKTTELLKFAYSNYDYAIYINLSTDNNRFIEVVLESGINPLSIDKYCALSGYPNYVDSSNTILIIDEIQSSVTGYNSIRELRSNLNCDIVVTGSYLGQTFKREFFQPAGTIEVVQMFPLSFREFCRVYKKEEIYDSIDLYGNSNPSKYHELSELYNIYRQIGGYPRVIQEYLRTGSIESTYQVISNLLIIFERESRNYFSDTKETLVFKTVYEEGIKEMVSEKRGAGTKLVETITNIVKSSQKMLVSRDEVSRAIQWLIYSGIIGELNLYQDRTQSLPSRRMYYLDCGIASYISTEANIEESNKQGILTEIFAYSELYRLYKKPYATKKVKGTVPSFSIHGSYELDFAVIGTNGKIYGIEVKTNRGNPKSLKAFLDKNIIDVGILAKNTIGGTEERYSTIPIYLIAKLEQEFDKKIHK